MGMPSALTATRVIVAVVTGIVSPVVKRSASTAIEMVTDFVPARSVRV